MTDRRARRRLVTAGWLLVVGCAQQPAPAASPGATGRCEAAEPQPVQHGSHLVGDAEPPVPYSTTPPTSGWHASGSVPVAVQPARRPLSEPELVSVLEAGGVVVSHRGLDRSQRRRLAAHVRRRWPGRVSVTGYDQLADGQVVFTAWGVLQRCDGVDLAALDAFAEAYAQASEFH